MLNYGVGVFALYLAIREHTSLWRHRWRHSKWTGPLVLGVLGCAMLRLLFLLQQYIDSHHTPPPASLLLSLAVSCLTWLLRQSPAPTFASWLFWCMACGVAAYDLSSMRQEWLLHGDSYLVNAWILGLYSIQLSLLMALLVVGFIDWRSAAAQGYLPIQPEDQQDSPASSWSISFRRLRTLLPFLWPRHDRFLQLLILISLVCLVLGRIVNILVPTQYKRIVDVLGALDSDPTADPYYQVILFVVLRALQGGVGFIQTIQNLCWIPNNQYTSRETSTRMLQHLHHLSLRFHLARKTGEVLRVMDRGTSSIVSLLQYIVFQIIPVLVDIAVACIYIAVLFDLYFASIIFVTMALYIYTSIALTNWRLKYRKEANLLENETSAKAVDSLLNFETVKYYGAEKFEVAQYEQALRRYQKADFKSSASLYLLNTAQNLIISLGLLVGCVVIVHRVKAGTMSIGDVVLFLTYITQLYVPLNWFGTFYRQIQQNFIDMEQLLGLFEQSVEVQDTPQAKPLVVAKGDIAFQQVSFAYDPRQPILKSLSFRVPGGSTCAIVGPT